MPVLIVTIIIFSATESYSQTRKLPDGSIVYPDGTKKLPNGTVVYKDGTVKKRNHGKQVIYRDSRREEERRRQIERRNRNNNGKWIPPGQAKKIYGGKARDYAPGQQKKWQKHSHDDKWQNKDRDNDHRENGHNKGKHKGKDD